MGDALSDAGVDAQVKVLDTWSPKFYNFESDGFEVAVTLDPARLRTATTEFDVDQWARDYYSSRDGFASFVTGRMEGDAWAAEYDGGFRVESLLAALDPFGALPWRDRVWDAENEIYAERVTISPDPEPFLDTTRTYEDWEQYAHDLTEAMSGDTAPLFEAA